MERKALRRRVEGLSRFWPARAAGSDDDRIARSLTAVSRREQGTLGGTNMARATRKTSAKKSKLTERTSRSLKPKLRTAAKPRLLSGGNPQIAKADGEAPVRAYIAAMPGWKRGVGERLDVLIERAVPGVRKAVRWNTPFYGVDSPDAGWFVAFHCITKYVKVTFFRGASLRPVPPVESKMKEVRYFHIFEGDDLDEKLVTDWIRQASRLPGENCF
jgi:hypothetical protein